MQAPQPARKANRGALRILERAKGLEPSTSTLARLRSTTELRPRGSGRIAGRAGVARGQAGIEWLGPRRGPGKALRWARGLQARLPPPLQARGPRVRPTPRAPASSGSPRADGA